MTHWSHTQSWSGNPPAVAGARRFVRACLATHRREDAAGDVALVVSELATNAVVHASTSFKVTLVGDAGSLVLTVWDVPSSQPDYGRDDLCGLGGRGLRIVDAHCSEWGSSPGVEGGKSVWASFDGDAQASTFRADGEEVGEAVR